MYICSILNDEAIMNIKLHTPKSLKAGSGMATLKQFLLSLIATTVSIVLTFGTAAIIDNNKKQKEKGGASWVMRKMVKMKFGKGRSDKMLTTYTVNGRNIVVKGRKENRIYTLSEDGQSLSYVMEKKKGTRMVVLKRVK